MGKSIADLDRLLGGTLDTTGPAAVDRPGTRTAVLAERLRTKLASRAALPADPGPAPNLVQVHGKVRYGGTTGPLVVSRVSAGARPEVPATGGTGEPVPAGIPADLPRMPDRGDAVPAPAGPSARIVDAFLTSSAARRRPAAAVAALRAGALLSGQTVLPDPVLREALAPHRAVDRAAAHGADVHPGRGGRSRVPEQAPALPLVARVGEGHSGRPGPLVEQRDEPHAEVEDPPEGDPPHWPGPFQFVTGPAGCGKTYLARQWGKHDKGFLLCATTGIAAVNLGDAVTIHSTLKFFDTASLDESFVQGHLQSRMRKLRASGVTRYGIDEVSMMPARVLTILTHAIEELNDDAAVSMGHEPAIGITLIGDFLQLPPVKEEYAFQSPEWPKYEAHMVRLSGTYRQADPDFIRALRAVRVGDPDAAMDVLGPHIQPTLDTRFDGTTILSKNQQVDRFNKLRHQELAGTGTLFKNTITGTPLKEWEKHIPMFVTLKAGAKVMILANRYVGDDDPQLLYANGDTGTFVEGNVSKKVAYVELHRNQTIVPVGYNIRQNLVPTGAKGKKKDRYTVLGEIEYMPLRLAYASSVHKSQGLTLDNVQVDISDRFFTAPAMVYVALSRARTLEGLRLVGNPELLRKRCTVDPLVERWR